MHGQTQKRNEEAAGGAGKARLAFVEAGRGDAPTTRNVGAERQQLRLDRALRLREEGDGADMQAWAGSG